ncbi:hypothetical protein [Streptomyces apocyni]|uniref:hypothetical protein n=1 Tax=Streptomyces apocyni TaxID=2654677 RepID=UPI0012EA7635|nr:hypothetical protein [Streptomyces apocyni]
MLALRLARGAHPLVQIRRLAVAAAAAGTGFLLLCALGYAMGHPGATQSAVLRLAWCAVPLAATVHLAVAVARTDPGTRPRPGLSALGLGPGRLALLAAATTAMACTLGSLLALLFFLHLRGDLTGLPFDGAAADLLGGGQSLPLAAALTLLALTPVIASCCAALVLRPRTSRQSSQPGHRDEENPRQPTPPAPAPTGLPWGVALIAVGLAVETYAATADATADSLPMPGRMAGIPVGVLAGWAVTALGLALAGPGLTALCGRLLATLRPGAARLLAGRVLREESRRIGRPLGVVCAVAAGVIAAAVLYGARQPQVGPLTVLGAVLVVGCPLLTLATAAEESRQARAHTTAALVRLGAPRSLLRGALALRAGALFAVFAPLTLAVAALAALPLAR